MLIYKGETKKSNVKKEMSKTVFKFRKQFFEYTNSGNSNIDNQFDIKKVGKIND